jgi:hypothetical protein
MDTTRGLYLRAAGFAIAALLTARAGSPPSRPRRSPSMVTTSAARCAARAGPKPGCG